MSRSGYSDDFDGPELYLWRGAVERAIKGKRGQAFLRDLVAALDALPQKRLIEDELQADGEVCALGAVGLARGIDMTNLDPYMHDELAEVFDIAPALVKEIEFENDGDFYYQIPSPETRWTRMRAWAVSQIIAEENR